MIHVNLCRRLNSFFRNNWREVGVFVATGVVWCLLALPASVRPLTHLWGSGGDALGDAVFYRLIAESPGLLPEIIQEIGAPAGYPIPWPRLIAQAPLTLFMLVTSGSVNGYFAVNLLGVLGFCLTSTTLYALGRRVTGDNLASLAGPIAVTFQAGQLWNGVGAPGFVHLWIISLLIYIFSQARTNQSTRNDFLAGGIWLLAMSWNPYLLLIALVVGSTLYSVTLLHRLRHQRDLPISSRLFLPALIAPTVMGVVIVVGLVVFDAPGIRSHAPDEVDLFSARPLEYILPPAGHLLQSLGDFFDPRPDVGTNLYVGGIACLLALLALKELMDKSDVAPLVLFTTISIAISVVFSGPRFAEILGVKVPLPAELIMHFTTAWRVFGRFGLVVLVGVGCLATVGLARVRNRFGTGMVLLLLFLMVLDLKSTTPQGSYSLQTHPALLCLRDLEAGVVIDLPTSDQNYEQWDRQSIHRHPISNGAEPGSEWDRILFGLDPSRPETYRNLHYFGVAYVVLDQKLLRSLNAEEMALSAGLKSTPCTDSRFTVLKVVSPPLGESKLDAGKK